MFAVRCVECGETRWALTRASYENLRAEPCEACGGKVVQERRRPGASPRKPIVERRDRQAAPGSLAGV
jgi:hypothetical protein